MTYDHFLTVYDLKDGTQRGGKLTENSGHLYAELEVYHRRYWESV